MHNFFHWKNCILSLFIGPFTPCIAYSVKTPGSTYITFGVYGLDPPSDLYCLLAFTSSNIS